MGFLDDAKDKVSEAVKEHGDKITAGLDKAAHFVDDKTGGKFGDKINAGVDKAKEGLDKIGGKDEPQE